MVALMNFPLYAIRNKQAGSFAAWEQEAVGGIGGIGYIGMSTGSEPIVAVLRIMSLPCPCLAPPPS